MNGQSNAVRSTALPLTMHALRQSFGAALVLRDINLQIRSGDIVGLVGVNGAGKSTLLQTVLGIYSPLNGVSHVFGEPSTALSDATKNRLTYVPQQPDLFGWLSARDLLDLMATLYATWDEQLALALAARWGVPLHQRIDQMSGGQQQRLQIVRALSSRPELLLLDEPVSQLDPAGRRQFLREIIDLCLESGSTVVFSSHIISDLERCANRIALLHQGELLLDAELDALKEQLFRITLPGEVAAALKQLPQCLAQRQREGTQVSVLWHGPQSALEQALRKCGRQDPVMPLSLEDLLVELGT